MRQAVTASLVYGSFFSSPVYVTVPIRLDAHFERQRLVSVQAEFDAMRPRFDLQPLEHAVEIVDTPGEVAVDIDRCVARLHLEAQRAVVVVAAPP